MTSWTMTGETSTDPERRAARSCAVRQRAFPLAGSRWRGAACTTRSSSWSAGRPRPRRSDDVLRYTMYAENYGREREAARLYASIDPSRTASHCATCSAPCERSCPFKLPIRDELVQADRLLRGA